MNLICNIVMFYWVKNTKIINNSSEKNYLYRYY